MPLLSKLPVTVRFVEKIGKKRYEKVTYSLNMFKQ